MMVIGTGNKMKSKPFFSSSLAFSLAVAALLTSAACATTAPAPYYAGPTKSAVDRLDAKGSGSGGTGAASTSEPVAVVMPAWVSNPEAVYPAQSYLTGLGTGRDPDMAMKSAQAALAQVFRARIQAVITNYESERRTSDGQVQSVQSNEQAIRATTDKQLESVEIANLWSDPNGVHYAIAILDRAQARNGILSQVREVDAGLLAAADIIDGKAPLIVRKSRIKAAQAAQTAADSTDAARAAAAAEAARAKANPTADVVSAGAAAVAASSVGAQTVEGHDAIVANAEDSFAELDAATAEPAPAVPASEVSSPVPVEEKAAGAQAASGSQPVENTSDSKKSVESASVAAPDFGSVQEESLDEGGEDVSLAASSRLQKMRLARRILELASRRQALNADLRIVSPDGAMVAAPAGLERLLSWADGAMHDLRVAIQLEGASGPTAMSLESGATAALSSLGMQTALAGDDSDVIVHIALRMDTPARKDGWIWSMGEVRVDVLDAKSDAAVKSQSFSARKASENEAEATRRLMSEFSKKVQQFVQETLAEMGTL